MQKRNPSMDMQNKMYSMETNDGMWYVFACPYTLVLVPYLKISEVSDKIKTKQILWLS